MISIALVTLQDYSFFVNLFSSKLPFILHWKEEVILGNLLKLSNFIFKLAMYCKCKTNGGNSRFQSDARDMQVIFIFVFIVEKTYEK